MTKRGRIMLDIREVEPRDRFETIMSAYDALESGESLDLTVDQDPKCMYYTLWTTRDEGSCDFEYLEDGPEVWRVHVRRL